MRPHPFQQLLESRLVFALPHRLTDVDHWHGHMPFAFFLVEMLQPSRIVELGTWKGDSYCCLCQAVEASGVRAHATAIDTWTGDAVGGYGPDVLAELRAYHEQRYARFSELWAMTFDEARDEVEDGSIDLLHIDGNHSYEAVRHDFESWLPKMSDRGVVLMHDTNARGDGYEVWRLWEEVAATYPSFEFSHSFGLGVLAVGSRPDAAVLAFLGEAAEHPGLASRFFEALGDRVLLAGRNRRLGPELTLAQQVLADVHATRTFRHTAQLRRGYSWLRTKLRRGLRTA